MRAGHRLWPIFLVLSLGFIMLLTRLILEPETTFLSPLAEGVFKKLAGRKTQVVGFLPYWSVRQDYQVKLSEIDQLIYFGLTVDKDGNIIQTENGATEPGFNRLKSEAVQNIFQEARRQKKKVLVSFISFNADVTDNIISDESARGQLIDQIMTVVKENDLDGVDIDFEYFPNADNLPDFGEYFNQFLRMLNIALKKDNTEAILSVDIYPKAVIYNWPYRLAEMGRFVDQIIIMAYDFTQSNSLTAGPVAPLKGAHEKEFSVVKTVEAALKIVDRNKLILGIPLYGYDWRTVSEEPRSRAYAGSGTTATYERVRQLIKDEKLEVKWDELAFSPWLVYKKGWQIRQIYFENLKSLALKIELAQQIQFKGIAFWALGYEGDGWEVWDLLKKKL